ncbi:MAG: DUF4332 domain-containing protein [Promethearchaeota archaeon]
MRKKFHSEVEYTLEDLNAMFQRMRREEYQLFTPHLNEILRILQREGLINTTQILQVVRTRKKVQPILERHEDSSRQLLGFMRKIRSLHPQKHSFKKLPDHIIDDNLIEKLKNVNIKNTWNLLDRTASREARETLTQKIGIDSETLQTLVEYADLMRLMYIGKILAMKYHEAGITGVEKLAKSDPDELHKRLTRIAAKEETTPPNKTDILNNIARAKELYEIFPLIE